MLPRLSGPPATVSPAFLRQIWYSLLFSPSLGEQLPLPGRPAGAGAGGALGCGSRDSPGALEKSCQSSHPASARLRNQHPRGPACPPHSYLESWLSCTSLFRVRNLHAGVGIETADLCQHQVQAAFETVSCLCLSFQSHLRYQGVLRNNVTTRVTAGCRDVCGHAELAQEPTGLLEQGQSCGGHGREVPAVPLFPGWEGKERQGGCPGIPPQPGTPQDRRRGTPGWATTRWQPEPGDEAAPARSCPAVPARCPAGGAGAATGTPRDLLNNKKKKNPTTKNAKNKTKAERAIIIK
ncbi:uncharacterized protein LOC128789939 [Vidua chalybeata]|uniref:uncharacterized protein LOC128789939 n=1 Tax=Vidua chalybeata TaxID=81927 RepID=UPI0023A81FFD|nr:uncharacterized protein LOC128789939 [Vidua chalybeata]